MFWTHFLHLNYIPIIIHKAGGLIPEQDTEPQVAFDWYAVVLHGNSTTIGVLMCASMDEYGQL